MMDATWLDGLKQDFFNALYSPTDDNFVQVTSFPKEIDVSPHGPYANYNWELFFHIPLMIAVHLSKTQRFAEAQRWFHYIFDPTSNDQKVDPPKRFWNFLAFRKPDGMKRIEDIVRILSIPRSELSSEEQLLQDEVLNGYDAIRNKPFMPHAVARTRHLAYQYCVVMKYLDNLIAWGDHLFQQDTLESINEATQIYVLAANILGARPQRIPPHGRVQPKSFAQLKAKGLGPIGDALVDLEGQFPFNLTLPNSGTGGGGESNALFGIGRTLYFCIPQNDKLLGYWDTVADRLFKIRHCMNIAGVVRPLDLFDPPIDPGMLVKAAAAGIDIGSVVSGLNQPVGPVRSLFLIQKALELCAEVRALGNALLSALEKGDAEHLALIRQRHEIKIAQMQQEVRFLQWRQAQEA
ncbi:MAG: toxin, partial [Nitrospiraceae bacterium]